MEVGDSASLRRADTEVISIRANTRTSNRISNTNFNVLQSHFSFLSFDKLPGVYVTLSLVKVEMRNEQLRTIYKVFRNLLFCSLSDLSVIYVNSDGFELIASIFV